MSAALDLAANSPSWRRQVSLRAEHATTGDRAAALAWSLAEIEDLLAAAACFDPDTGAPVGRPMSAVLADLRSGLAACSPTIPRDTMVRAALLAAEPLAQVAASPRTRLQRQHAMERPERVRAMDARSMAWLARQPGLDARSKLGACRKLLAVVREESAEVPANRFVRRLAAELEAHLDAVLAPVGTDDEIDDRARVLRALRTLCRLDREGSPLADVRVAVAPVPDNVLLGDRRYALLWRVWQALRTLDDAAYAMWRNAASWLGAAVAWAVVAGLSAREDAVVEERWVTFDVERPGTGSEGARVRLRTRDDLRCVTVRADREGIAIDEVRWSGVGLMQRRPALDWSLRCEYDAVSPVVPGAGHAAVLELGTERLLFHVSRGGLREIAGRVIEALQLPAPQGSVRQGAPGVADGWHCAGIDLAGPRARVSVGGAVHSGPLLLARCTTRDGHAAWVAGEAVARWAPSERGEAWSAVDLWRAAVEPGLGAAEAPAIAALAGIPHDVLGAAASGARVAVAMPDGLDELSLATLRASLSGAFAHGTCWVWRSVAAALGWRDEGGCPVAPGEALVVIDLAMPRFGGAVLVAREDGTPDRWYWERPLATPASQWSEAHDACTAVAESIQVGNPSVAAHAAELAVAYGVGEQSGGDGCVVPTEAEHYLTSMDPADAARRIVLRAVAWAENFQRSGALRRAQRAGDGGTVHVLVVGAPTGDNTAHLVASALRDGVGWCRSSVHVPRAAGGVVARGAEVAVERLAQRLPAWVDILPRLCLEVTTRGGRREIEVFPRRAVRAGEDVPYRVSERMRIPAGLQALKLPLLRDDDGRSVAVMDARIEDPSFPLARDVEVRIDVRFSRADDRFHVTLRPVGAAPFSSLEVRWARHTEEVAREQTILDEPPAWPAVVPFAELAGEVFEKFERAAALLEEHAAPLEAKRLKPRIHRARSSVTERDRLVADLGRLAEALQVLEDAVGRLFAPGRRVDDAPPKLRARVGELVATLDVLVTKASWSDEKTTELRGAGGRVVAAAARVMSRLRGAATEAFVQWVLNVDAGPLVAQRWHLLGRVLADGRSPARARAIASLAETLQTSGGPRTEHVGALATALWADEGFVTAAAPHLDAWLQGVTLALDAIEKKGSKEGLFDECAAALLGLLRLRATPHGGPLSAYREEVRALGARIARIDRLPGPRARPRLRVSGDRALADVTASALRGETVARIEMIEEER